MFSHKYQNLVFSFLMALFMSGIMSFVISVFNMGLVSNIIAIWLKAWGFGFIVAFPTINIIAPVVNKLVSLIINENTE